MMDIIGNCLVPHQRCQQLQVGGKIVGVAVYRGSTVHRVKSMLRGADVCESSDAFCSDSPHFEMFKLILEIYRRS